MVAKSAVIGIDLGTSESYVAYVGKGIVDVVQNEVSKRATPTLVGFTDRERLLGDAALAQIRSNAKNTCRNFKHLLGRRLEATDLQQEHFWSTSKLVSSSDDGLAGYEVSYKGEQREFSATQVTAMFLTKLREVTEKWCQAKVADVVIAVPAYFSDVQRQALLDAAKIADLSVLKVMNEHTATALAYGIYRSNDFDPEKPMTVAFCSMGHSIFSVSIVRFVRGKLQVVCERSDRVGGRDMDECLMREFAAQFEKKHGCDPLSNKKSAFKLEDAVTKTKKILSANSEAPFNIECLMDDHDFSSTVTRADFERMCGPAIARAKAVLEAAKAASGLSLEEIDSVEIVGGSSRVPWVKQVCSEAFGGKELSTTMNQEESVARGCALQAAILSPLYKVRDFKVEDASSHTINIGWTGVAAEAEPPQDTDGDAQMTSAVAEGEYKTAPVFPACTPLSTLKMLTFYRKGPFDLKAEYADEQTLLPGTPKELGTFRVELPPQPEAKKVKVRASLTLHGTFCLEGAQLLEEEEYEETVKEKRELPPEPDSPTPTTEEPPASPPHDVDAEATPPTSSAGASPDGDAAMPDASDAAMANEAQRVEAAAAGEAVEGGPKVEEKKVEDKKVEKKAKEPRYEWVDVVKRKKRTKRTDLVITETGRPGLSQDALLKRAAEEFAMQADMREIIETDERRNDLEAYFLSMREKAAEAGEYGAFISAADREKFLAELTVAEDWLYDNPDATKAQLVDKLEELKQTGDPLAWRFKESGRRDEWIAALTGTVANFRAAAENPAEKYSHIAAEKLAKVKAACDEAEAWLTDLRTKQDALPKYERPVLICAEIEAKNQALAKTCDAILKEPKPAPKKEAKKQEKEPEKEAKKEEKEAEKEEQQGKEEVKEEKTEQSPVQESQEPSPAAAQDGAAEAVPAEGPQNMDLD